MGSNDAREQLEVCKADQVANEARIRDLEQRLAAAEIDAADRLEQLEHVRRLADDADMLSRENDPPREYGFVGTPTLRRAVGPAPEPHVEIGGARMLESQYHAARFGLLDRCDVLEQQVATLEAENRRLETALLERLDHDHHGTAALERELADARARLALVDGISASAGDGTAAEAVQEILGALHGARPGVLFAGDDAEVALVAFRHLATSLRILEPVTPGRPGHLAPQVHRFDLLGDRVEEYLTGAPDFEEPGDA